MLHSNNQKLTFSVDQISKQKVIEIFNDENSEINPYYPRFKSHQLTLIDLGSIFELSFSKQGLVELKTSNEKIVYFKKVVKPSDEEKNKHFSFLKTHLKKNNFN